EVQNMIRSVWFKHVMIIFYLTNRKLFTSRILKILIILFFTSDSEHEPPGVSLRLEQGDELPGPEDSPGEEGLHAEGGQGPGGRAPGGSAPSHHLHESCFNKPAGALNMDSSPPPTECASVSKPLQPNETCGHRGLFDGHDQITYVLMIINSFVMKHHAELRQTL
uniref:Uncharacterized protein n=1 Tax=Scophthalmus maximus TaxID=52904 RepID=A0A8D3EB69_SCOMX